MTPTETYTFDLARTKEVFERVKARLRKEPTHYNQITFGQSIEQGFDEYPISECDSQCCIAGHALIELVGFEGYLKVLKERQVHIEVYERLGLLDRYRELDLPPLFASLWYSTISDKGALIPAQKAMVAAQTAAERAEAGCLAIDLFLKWLEENPA